MNRCPKDALCIRVGSTPPSLVLEKPKKTYLRYVSKDYDPATGKGVNLIFPIAIQELGRSKEDYQPKLIKQDKDGNKVVQKTVIADKWLDLNNIQRASLVTDLLESGSTNRRWFRLSDLTEVDSADIVTINAKTKEEYKRPSTITKNSTINMYRTLPDTERDQYIYSDKIYEIVELDHTGGVTDQSKIAQLAEDLYHRKHIGLICREPDSGAPPEEKCDPRIRLFSNSNPIFGVITTDQKKEEKEDGKRFFSVLLRLTQKKMERQWIPFPTESQLAETRAEEITELPLEELIG